MYLVVGGGGGGASKSSEAVHGVRWLWDLPGCIGHGVLPGATQPDLLSNLQMAATCAGLGGAQARPSCEPKPAAATARSGATQQKLWGILRPDAAYLRDFRKI